MKTFLRIILLLIIAAVVALVLFYEWRPISKDTFISNNNNSNSGNIIPDNQSTSLPVTIITIDEKASTSPSVSVEYPQFPSLPANFNYTIKSAVETRLADFRKISIENNSDYSFIAKWQPAQINNRYVSLMIRFDSYVGGANEEQDLVTFNYDIKANKILSLGDLFGSTTSDYLTTTSLEARKQLTENFNKITDGNAPTETIIAGTEPTIDSFKYFTFTEYLIKIYFPKYSVAPGSFGEQTVTLPLQQN